MTRKEQVSNGFTEMMKGFWGNQDLEVPDFEEPCGDAISRILKRMWNCRGEHTTSIDKVKMEQIIRDELLSVTPKPKTGHWIDKDEKSAVCSCCNKNNILYGDFCKWCGAKMVESQERSDKE